jgi:GWxTD domain-containing protein
MKATGWLWGCFCLVLALHGAAWSQVEIAGSAKQKEDEAGYDVDAISFASNAPGMSRVDVFVQVGYEALSFVKEDGRYAASYEMTIALHDSTGRLVSEKLWTEEVKAKSFDESVSSQAYSLVQRVFEVIPGKYSISTILRDNETRESKPLLRQLSVPDYATPPFALSDIMLVSRLSLSGDKRVIVPNVSSNVGNVPDAFHVFFEAYNKGGIDSVRFVANVLDGGKTEKLEVEHRQKLETGRSQVFIRIDNTQLPLGDYTVYVRAFPAGDSVTTASTSRKFVIRWQGVPRGVKDLDVAIDQLQYIAKDSELAHMREATTPEEKQKRFLEFWKSKDPNPNTPRNEKMNEYYAKVEYANKHFKHYIEGWRTDMGMVFIIFGSPNNVDRHPFDIDSKPYEVWSYYDMNHQFVFVDQTGFGDYRLITPIWEVWQRPKN